MDEMTKHGQMGLAAARAGMDRKTARKYVRGGKLPSELVQPRNWRTRNDSFREHWSELETLLQATPALEAKTLFEVLVEKYPGRYKDGQLRTLQRRVKCWRAERGPDKEAVLAQCHRPGEAAQTDFTWVTELGVTICGEAFVHMLCVFVLPYSNWRWATICFSESIASLRAEIQRALFQLGRVPEWHQTDNSTAATHRPKKKDNDEKDNDEKDNDKKDNDEKDNDEKDNDNKNGTKRPFNSDYMSIMRHFGMKPRTTEVGAKEQNGDVESANGAFKRALEQALLVRGHRDFETREAWQQFIDDIQRKANSRRGKRLDEDLAAMHELSVARLPEFTEEDVRVTERSTIRIKHCAYSVPSRLIGEWVRVRIYEDRLIIRALPVNLWA